MLTLDILSALLFQTLFVFMAISERLKEEHLTHAIKRSFIYVGSLFVVCLILTLITENAVGYILLMLFPLMVYILNPIGIIYSIYWLVSRRKRIRTTKENSISSTEQATLTYLTIITGYGILYYLFLLIRVN